MNSDLLIGLIVIGATIVQALVTSSRKRKGTPPPRPRAAPPPARTTLETKEGGALPPAETPEGSFQRRLEEARRRVQEAMGEAKTTPARPVAPSQAPVTNQELQPALASRPAPSSPLARAESYRPGGTSNEAALEVAPPIRVQRTARQKTARLSSDELFQLDPRSIYQGVIWHQVLSPPLSKRRSRRKPSRRP